MVQRQAKTNIQAGATALPVPLLPSAMRNPLSELYISGVLNSGAGKLVEIAKELNDAHLELCKSYAGNPIAAMRRKPLDADSYIRLSDALDVQLKRFSEEARWLYKEDLAGTNEGKQFTGQALGAIDCFCIDGVRQNLLPLLLLASFSPAPVARAAAHQLIGKELQDMWVEVNVRRENNTLGSAEGRGLLVELMQLHKGLENLSYMSASHLELSRLPALVQYRHSDVISQSIPDVEQALKNA